MAFKASLEVNGKTGKDAYQVLSCVYSLTQPVDDDGRPVSAVTANEISIRLKSTDDNFFYEWMIDPKGQQDGKIIFNHNFQDSKMKEIEFKNAYCINYTETFDKSGSEGPMNILIKITPTQLSVGGIKIDNVFGGFGGV